MKALVQLVFTTLTLITLGSAPALAADDPAQPPRVLLETSSGDIIIELNPDKAPLSSANFLEYVDSAFYSGTIFHRVIDGFMIQGGGFTEDYNRKETRDAIQNEADNGLENKHYTIAMARTRDPHSATAQFFINTTDNAFLNHRSKDPAGWGYTVFGQVVEGKDVVDEIGQVATGAGGPFRSDVPRTPVVIKGASLIEDSKEDIKKEN